MATFPFEQQKPSGYAYGEVPTSAQMDVIDEQAAAAASGAIWSDLSLGKAWVRSAAVPFHGAALVWSVTQKRWYSFGFDGSGNPTGAYLPIGSSTWTTGLTMQNGAGLLPWAAAVSPSGILVVGGRPGASSTSKIRESTDGATWTARATNASGTTAVRTIVWHAAASKFIAALDNAASTNIETSTNGQTWTQITGLPDSLPRGTMATNGEIVVCASDTFGGETVSSVITSTDGANWTQRSLPVSGFTKGITWEAARGLFILIVSNRCVVSEDGITWTDARSHNASAIQVAAHESGRALVFASRGSRRVYHSHYDSNARRMRTNAAFEMDDTFAIEQIPGSCVAVGNNQFMIADESGNHYWTISCGS